MNVLNNDHRNRSDNQEAFNRFMFGDRHTKNQAKEDPPPEEQQASNIDFTKLMEQSDVLMSTISELSPYFKKIPSLLSKFTNLIK